MLPSKMTIRAVRKSLSRLARRPGLAAVLSFLAAIMLGAAILCTPLCSRVDPADGQRHWTHPVNALFTATSAVCVTGLIVKDTGGDWSHFGQVVILVLIQAGGLGIMTIYAFMVTMTRRRLGMGLERMLGGELESMEAVNTGRMIRFICLFALVAEAMGAVALFVSWRSHFPGFWQCAYHSIFHSISAFCNAGFSLNSQSLMAYRDSLPVNLVVWTLIVFGGLGFLVVKDLLDYAGWWLFRRRGRRPKLEVHTALVLAVTAFLLAVGFFVFLLVERHHSLDGMALKERLLAAGFHSVTPRTAGFNTVNMNALAPSTALLVMALMFVGGSPGSTAGGVKTTTLGVMLASILATVHGRDKAELFHHSVRQETVHRVASIILLSVCALLAGTFLLLMSERSNHFSFLRVAFEASSAYGTVGLSLGITAKLTVLGRLIISALMFIGRLGPVTLMMTAMAGTALVPYEYPEARVIVG